MIVFDLLCSAGHRFEGWFASAEDFSSQRGRGLVSCPSCGTADVQRIPSAARVNFGAQPPKSARPPAQPAPSAQQAKTPDMDGKDPFAIAQMLYSRMLDDLFTKTEDVGAKFPEEARKIFYEEAPARAIRGQASAEEHDALIEEGIPVARFPIPRSEDLN
ncbi:MAG TPA: DUF1178 family protein [Sphingomicrobium sp.]|jgi:hypothetical protein|nr:DUF1178 family protein [Sphingomicrobium sp.]